MENCFRRDKEGDKQICKTNLKLWMATLLDGWNRLRLRVKHKEIHSIDKPKKMNCNAWSVLLISKIHALKATHKFRSRAHYKYRCLAPVTGINDH